MQSQSFSYQKKLVDYVLQYFYEDDFFRRKRGSWEDWVVVRADIQLAVKKLKKSKVEVKADNIIKILNKGGLL